MGTDAVVMLNGLNYTFGTDDFGFSDPGNDPPDAFAGIILTTLPEVGTLTAFGSGVARGQFIAFEDLAAGELQFAVSEAESLGYATFMFQVQDTGSSGGVNIDPTPNTFTLFFDSAQNNFMQGLYSDLLNRAPDAAGLIDWLDALDSGLPREQVAQAMWEAPEHRGIQVDSFYELFLNREADPDGRQSWINQFQTGVSETAIMAQFLLTDEYQQNNASNEAFVTQVYRDVLLRDPESAGLDAWVSALDDQTLTRAEVAAGLIGTTERNSNLVDLYYQEYFNRVPDSFGEAFWTDALDDGTVDDEGLAVALLSTVEYLNMQH